LFSKPTFPQLIQDGSDPPEEKQEMMEWQWHQVDHTQIICTSLQTNNHVSMSSLILAGCSSDIQPTVSKYGRQLVVVKELNWLVLHRGA